MSDERADFYLQLQDRLKTDRGNWEIQWTEIAERISTKDDDFMKEWAAGSKRQFHVFDSTAMLALPKFAAALEQMATPRIQLWHRLVPIRDDLKADLEVRSYLDIVNRILFQSRYAPGANFQSQINEVYRSLGAYGTGCLFTDDARNDMNSHGVGLRYKSIFLGELYIMENAVGAIDHVHRRYKLSARQVMQKFDKDKVPEIIRQKADSHPEMKFEFLHIACPNPDRDPRKKTFRGMPFSSFHISYDGRNIVEEGGYTTQPYAVSRYVTSSREVYGRSPAIDVLPDIKMANAQKETLLRAGQLAVDPPTLLQDDGLLPVFDSRPGSNNFGMVNNDGKPLAIPFVTGANLEMGVEVLQDTRGVINEAFLVTLFRMLTEAPEKELTAYEWMLRSQTQGALFGPTVGRLQDELLGITIQREISILARSGILPPMPQQLVEAGGEFDIQYEGPLARAQRAEQAIGLTNTLNILTPVAQIDPTVMDRFNFDEITKDIALDINGMPATWLNDDKVLAAIRAGRKQQQDMQQLIAAAPAASSAAANIAKLQQASGGGGLPNLSALAGTTQGA
jgi:hypothetical protein